MGINICERDTKQERAEEEVQEAWQSLTSVARGLELVLPVRAVSCWACMAGTLLLLLAQLLDVHERHL